MSPPYRRTQLNRAYSCCCGLPLPRAMLLEVLLQVLRQVRVGALQKGPCT